MGWLDEKKAKHFNLGPHKISAEHNDKSTTSLKW